MIAQQLRNASIKKTLLVNKTNLVSIFQIRVATMAGITSGVGGFAPPPVVAIGGGDRRTSEDQAGAGTDLPLLWTDHSAQRDSVGFLEFFQIFYLGNTRLMMSTSPRGSAGRQFALDEDIISDIKNRDEILGDALKNTMVLQTLRRVPLITSVPLIVTLVLIVVDVFKLMMPMKETIIEATPLAPIIAPFTVNSRKRRSTDVAENTKSRNRLTNTLASLSRTVYWALENKGWLDSAKSASDENDEPDQIVRNSDQDRQGFVLEGGVAKQSHSSKMAVLKDSLSGFTDILIELGSCVGNLVGCQVRKVFWSSPCQEPDGLVNTCSGLLGTGISNLVGVLLRSESD